MTNRTLVYSLVVAAIATAGVVYWQRHAALVGSNATQRTSAAVTLASNPAGAGASDAGDEPAIASRNVSPPIVPPSSMNERTDVAQSASSPKHPPSPSEIRSAAMNEAIHQFQSMTQEQRRDPAEVAKALERLEAANGSAILGTVDLEVLRHNLLVVGRMREVSAQIQSLQASSSAAGASESQAELGKKLDELRGLSGEMRPVIVHAPIQNDKPD